MGEALATNAIVPTSMGGQLTGSQYLTIGGESYSEVFYGWPEIHGVATGQLAAPDDSQP